MINKTEILNDILYSKPTKDIKVFITTWNMGNAEPEGIDNIFKDNHETLNNYGIFVIGLQESTYNDWQNKNKTDTDCKRHLSNVLTNVFGDDFFQVRHVTRAQLQLFVYAKNELKHRITNIQQSIENTGFLHIFPNKGGILVAFHVDGSKLAFVSCHLTAHEGVKHCEERNLSIVEILGGVRAGDVRFDITEQFHHIFWMGDMNYRTTYDTVNIPADTKKNKKENLKKHLDATSQKIRNASTTRSSEETYIIPSEIDEDDEEDEEEDANLDNSTKKSEKVKWIADMNNTLDLVVCENWNEILKYDELNRELQAGRVLNGFTALQPSFPPTFKRSRHQIIEKNFNVSSKNFHVSTTEIHATSKKWNIQSNNKSITNSDSNVINDNKNNDADNVDIEVDGTKMVNNYYHPKRIPSYTDRILYKTMNTFENYLQPLFFDSCEHALSSDHKPVRAGFLITITEGEKGILVDRSLASKTSINTNNQLTLEFSDLKGENLEEMDAAIFGGGSDPYIIITCDPPSLLLRNGKISSKSYLEGIKSKVIKHSLNPEWTEPIEVPIASFDLKGLSLNATLLLSVWDEDLVSADDLIGTATIPFQDIIKAYLEGKPYIFNKQIYANSEVMGKISGKINIKEDISELQKKFSELSHTNNNGKFNTLYETREEAIQNRIDCACIIA